VIFFCVFNQLVRAVTQGAEILGLISFSAWRSLDLQLSHCRRAAKPSSSTTLSGGGRTLWIPVRWCCILCRALKYSFQQELELQCPTCQVRHISRRSLHHLLSIGLATNIQAFCTKRDTPAGEAEGNLPHKAW